VGVLVVVGSVVVVSMVDGDDGVDVGGSVDGVVSDDDCVVVAVGSSPHAGSVFAEWRSRRTLEIDGSVP
jgi:hypothetical protein